MFRPATVQDVVYIARNLHDHDKAELKALHGDDVSFEAILLHALQLSPDAEVGEVEGCPPMLVRGCADCGTFGAVWMLRTPATRRYARAYLAEGRSYVASLLTRFPIILNYVDARNTDSIRWLKHLGFTFAPPVPVGASDALFIPFSKSRKSPALKLSFHAAQTFPLPLLRRCA